MSDKEYIFHKYSEGKHERIVMKESELADKEKNLLLGEIIKAFNNAPKDVQLRFANNFLNYNYE